MTSTDVKVSKQNEVKVQEEFVTLAKLNDLKAAMDEELAGLSINFDRIKIPAGGSTALEIPDTDGEDTRMVKELRGVILFHHPANAYYSDKYVGGSNPPECGSFDGITGHGTPGGSCETCPYNQFGSSEEGAGKACKNRQMLYILLPGEMFPVMLSLPTGSLKSFSNYAKHQLTKGRKLSQVVTKFSLKKATSSTGIAFAQAVFSFERTLTEEEKQAMNVMQDQVKDYAAHLKLSVLTPMEEGFVNTETGEVVKPLK